MSFLEIYNEELIDLLGAESVENPRLKIYEDSTKKVTFCSLGYSGIPLKVHSHQAKIEAKAKIFFNASRLFVDIFRFRLLVRSM